MLEIPAFLSVAADSKCFGPIQLAKNVLRIGPAPPIHPASDMSIISLPFNLHPHHTEHIHYGRIDPIHFHWHVKCKTLIYMLYVSIC